jgi:LL-diaminopimelate aminotransferase
MWSPSVANALARWIQENGIQEMNGGYWQRRQLATGEAALVEVTPPRATLYLWVPLPEGVQSAQFAKQALEEQGVVTLPGSAFGPSGEGFFRVALTVSAERLEEAAERLGRVLARA